MAGKRQEQDKQQAAASVETPAQAGQSLPMPPKPLDDPAMVERGFQAREFQRSLEPQANPRTVPDPAAPGARHRPPRGAPDRGFPR